jgi:hypothetical protein
MRRFCLYTEDVNREGLFALVSELFPGFTVKEATGFWEGVRERALVIEIICDEGLADNIADLADDICTLNNQEAVLVTSERVNVNLVQRKV